MKECNVNELSERLKNEGLILIDVREPVEHASGRIQGSKLIPLGQIDQRSSEIDRQNDVHVICRTGVRSGKAQKKLQELGFENVTNVAGGFQAWMKAGLPFDADERVPWDIERQVRFVAGLFVLAKAALSSCKAAGLRQQRVRGRV